MTLIIIGFTRYSFFSQPEEAWAVSRPYQLGEHLLPQLCSSSIGSLPVTSPVVARPRQWISQVKGQHESEIYTGRRLEKTNPYSIDCFFSRSGDTTPGTPPSSHGSGVALSTLAEDSEDDCKSSFQCDIILLFPPSCLLSSLISFLKFNPQQVTSWRLAVDR